jgi:hypothetical protein
LTVLPATPRTPDHARTDGTHRETLRDPRDKRPAWMGQASRWLLALGWWRAEPMRARALAPLGTAGG